MHDTGTLRARLRWYAPGLRMARHAHERHQLSLLLVGTLGEDGPREEMRLDVPAVGIKPAGSPHTNDYGPAGALILTVEVDPALDLGQTLRLPARWQWRTRPSAALLACGRALLRDMRHGLGGDGEGRLWELVACMDDSDGPPPGRPPDWVARSRARLHEEATPLAELAHDEGLHPVYFARGFLRWTGWRPSAYRAHARVQRALAAIAGSAPLADVALQAGFADQAHFTRAVRHFCGLSPTQLRALMA